MSKAITRPMADTTNDNPNDQITDEQRAYAYVFLNDLRTNKAMATGWKAALAKVNNKSISVSDRITYLDNFLAEQGYTTTAPAVLDLIKTDWWNTYNAARQPNEASDQFVQDLLQNPALYKEWGAVIAQAASADDLNVADQWLANKGYKCTSIQVDASFQKMRDKNLNYWTGIYGQTLLQQEGAKSEIGPALIVYGDTTATVGPDKLFGIKYEKGALSWELAPKDAPFPNPFAGKITFSQISQPRGGKDTYVGNFFSGTLTYPDDSASGRKGVYNYSGRIGEPPDNKPGHVLTPPSVNKSAVEQIAQTLAPYVMIGFAITLLFGGAKAIFNAGSAAVKKLKERGQEEANKASEETAKERSETPLDEDEFSTSTEVKKLQDQLQETGDPQRQSELEEQIREQEEAETKYEEEQAKEGSEDGDMAEDLEGDLIEF